MQLCSEHCCAILLHGWCALSDCFMFRVVSMMELIIVVNTAVMMCRPMRAFAVQERMSVHSVKSRYKVLSLLITVHCHKPWHQVQPMNSLYPVHQQPISCQRSTHSFLRVSVISIHLSLTWMLQLRRLQAALQQCKLVSTVTSFQMAVNTTSVTQWFILPYLSLNPVWHIVAINSVILHSMMATTVSIMVGMLITSQLECTLCGMLYLSHCYTRC